MCSVANKPSDVKSIDRGIVRDLGRLFISGGHLVTVNPCSDGDADKQCDEVVTIAGAIRHDGLVVIERMQARGDVSIDRPHVHWVLSKPKDEVVTIAERLRAKGLDVHITPIWSVDGLLRYLGKDPNARCYMMKAEDSIKHEAMPVARQEREASDGVLENESSKVRNEFGTGSEAVHDRELLLPQLAGLIAPTVRVVRRWVDAMFGSSVLSGMCRAP